MKLTNLFLWKKRFARGLMAVLILPLLIGGAGVNADTETSPSPETIRIGYIDYGSFIEKDADDNYSGYGVEYLEAISRYTGWQYEYVYDTWENCLEMLQNKEIDFVGTAQKTPEREKIYDFADYSNGVEQTVVYTRLNNQELYYNDYASFDGKKVGLLTDSFQTEFFDVYAEAHDFSYEGVYFPTEDAMERALDQKEIDIMVGGSLALHTELKVIGKEGADPFYFMTYKGNDEILQALNAAMEAIQNEHPYYAEELAKFYYGDSVITSQPQFTREEVEYIQTLPVLKVGCLSDCYPISRWNKKDQKAEGIAIDLMNQLAQDIGVTISYVPVLSGQIPKELLQDGSIDLMLPSVETGYKKEREDHILLSNTILNETMAAITREGEGFQPSENYRVAFVSDFPEAEDIVKKHVTSYTPVYRDSIQACLQAVTNHEADVYFENYYIAAYRLKSPYFQNLQENYGHTFLANYGIAAADENGMLIEVLNKAINALNEDQTNDIIGHHTLGNNYELSLGERLYANIQILAAVIVIVVLIIGVLTIIFIIQRKNVKAIEEKNRQLEIANRVRESFLSNMSHEIRTPLNGIKGSLDILSGMPQDEKTRKLLTMTSISANHLISLVNDILDMSKIESGDLQLHRSYMSSKEFFSQLDETMRPLAEEKKIQIVEAVGECEYSYFYLERNRLNQICMNLLSNSIQYTQEGGKIWFQVSFKVMEPELVEVTLVIEDNGCGMSEETLQKVLEPFMQERSLNEKRGGGIGLSITKDLIRLMGGTFTLESKEGIGTRAMVQFQAKAKKSVDEPVAEAAPAVSRSNHLLIVEDNQINAAIVRMQVEADGFVADEVENGKLAVEKFEQSENGYYSIILMDIMMPVMDGLEATRQIRALPRPDAKTVIIAAMTANAYVEDISQSVESGMDAYLSKPFDQSELKEVLQMTARREKM